MFNLPVIDSYFEELARTIPLLPLQAANQLVRLFLGAYNRGHTIFLFGNGGSAALASHMACDLGKGASPGSSKRLRVVALTDNVPLLTAWANDTSYENVFAQQLENLVRPGDVVCAISASGNSPNVLAALQLARSTRAITAGLTGFQGGMMKRLCDVCVVVPSNNMQIIEDLHLSLAHAVFIAIREKIREASQETVAASVAVSSGGRLPEIGDPRSASRADEFSD